MWQLIISFVMCIYTETTRFIITNIITAAAANICSFPPTDFAYILCHKLGIFQAISCLYFPLILILIKMKNNISYVTRIFYSFSCLVSLCPSFSPPVVNHLLWNILVEICRVPFIPTLTSLTKIVGIDIIHSKDWSINADTPILGLKLPLQLEIILPRTVDLCQSSNLWNNV